MNKRDTEKERQRKRESERENVCFRLERRMFYLFVWYKREI